MKKIYLFLFLITSVLSFGQITNGGFETWTDPTFPDNWTFETGTTLIENTTTFSEGASSMEVSVTTGDQGNTDFRQSVPVTAGTVYDVSVDVYHTDDKARARLYAGNYQGYSDETILNTWQSITYTYTAGATGNIDFGLRFYDSATFAGGPSLMYIDNFTITPQATPSMAITSPTDGAILYNQDVDVAFSVQNFNVANGTGDGYVVYSLDGAPNVDKFDVADINFTTLAYGSHILNMELVDNGGMALVPAVVSSVSFTISQIQTLPFTESFNYTIAENISEQAPWTNYFSGDEALVDAANLTYSTLSGSGASMAFDGSGADPVVDYTPTSSGSIYSSFMLQVTALDAAPVNGYFVTLRNSGGSYESRVWISPVTATTYNIGVSNGGTLTQISAVTPHNINDVVFIVFNYDIDNDTVSAWINPTLGVAEPAADLTEASGSSGNTFNQILFRQDSGTETPTLIIDELRIGTSWSEVTPSTLSNSNFSSAKSFKIYPNPTNSGFVTIQSASTETMNVTIFDILGKQISKSKVENNTLNVSNLKAGVYLLNITQNNLTTTKKLVVN
ncbi:T9SS type A sorting domain-containing protein [Aurantibacter sp.]|uniref:T9SS type A sorting domain-containing protein n=1 Tax=Aurantibacter sp. TaxID=2807103 RepID=UPI0035C79022